jgi:hypothetical protein
MESFAFSMKITQSMGTGEVGGDSYFIHDGFPFSMIRLSEYQGEGYQVIRESGNSKAYAPILIL